MYISIVWDNFHDIVVLIYICRCFVIDRSGFLLIHNSFYPTSPSSCDDISNIHITCGPESYIAWSLFQNHILVNDYCISYAGVNKLKFWKVSYISTFQSSSNSWFMGRLAWRCMQTVHSRNGISDYFELLLRSLIYHSLYHIFRSSLYPR